VTAAPEGAGEEAAPEVNPAMADYFAPSTDQESPVAIGSWVHEWIALGGRPPEDFAPGTLAAILGSEDAVAEAFLDAFDAVALPPDDPRAMAFAEEVAS